MKKQILTETNQVSPRHALFAAGGLVLLFVTSLVFAPLSAGAATLLSQTYKTNGSLPIGSIVSLQNGTTDQVSSATTSNSDYILGVVIDGDSSQLSISSADKNVVSVATSGTQQVLVSDINGNIVVGDPITASPISGVGMKATGNVKVIGVAQEAFPNTTAKRQEYTDEDKQKQATLLGQVSVLINVSYYYKQPDKSIIPPAIQNIANALAGKKVNTLPILISIGIFIVAMVVVVSIIYSMIRSSIISVGRNPLSQAAIYRNVIYLSALVILILGVTIGAIYMVLTKF